MTLIDILEMIVDWKISIEQNGKDLYEGDIIYFSDSYNQVVWEDDLCAFVLVGVESHSYYVHCDILKNLPFYIVGNKFDKEK